jgi:hypothetical protein
MGDEDIGYVRWNGFIVCYGCNDDPGIGAQKARANAEFVVQAATYHTKLVEALRMLLKDPNHPIVDANARTLLAQLDGELE